MERLMNGSTAAGLRVFLAFVFLFQLTAPAYAGSKTISGEKCVEMTTDMTYNQAKAKAEREAYLEAMKSLKLFTEKQYTEYVGSTKGKEYQDIHSSLSLSVMGFVSGGRVTKASPPGGAQVCVSVTGEVDPDEMERMMNLSRGVDRDYQEEYQKLVQEYNALKRQVDKEKELLQREVGRLEDGVSKNRNLIASANTELQDFDAKILKSAAKVEYLDKGVREFPDDEENKTKLQDESRKLANLRTSRDVVNKRIEGLRLDVQEGMAKQENYKKQIGVKEEVLAPKRQEIFDYVFARPITVLASSSEIVVMDRVAGLRQNVTGKALASAQKMAVNGMNARINDLPPDMLQSDQVADARKNLETHLQYSSHYHIKEGKKTDTAQIRPVDEEHMEGLTTVEATFNWQKEAVAASTVVRPAARETVTTDAELQRLLAESRAKVGVRTQTPPPPPPPVEEGSSWWKWALLVLAIGGAAAAAGGSSSGSSGGGGGGGSTGSVSVSW